MTDHIPPFTQTFSRGDQIHGDPGPHRHGQGAPLRTGTFPGPVPQEVKVRPSLGQDAPYR